MVARMVAWKELHWAEPTVLLTVALWAAHWAARWVDRSVAPLESLMAVQRDVWMAEWKVGAKVVQKGDCLALKWAELKVGRSADCWAEHSAR